jgi:hypothetical protein
MKDRYAVGQWPTEWIEAVLRDMPRMSRETRLFLAKMVRVTAEAMGRSNAALRGGEAVPSNGVVGREVE